MKITESHTSDPMGITTSLVSINGNGTSKCPFTGDSSRILSDDKGRENEESSECPFMAGFSFTSLVPSLNCFQESQSQQNQIIKIYRVACPHFVLETKHPPSSRFMSILDGLNEPGDAGNPPEPPPWLDRELFDQGRLFYKRYLTGICFSNLLSLVLMLSSKGGLQPLIYTGKSDTPSKALKRYFSTVLHVITWYKGDVWDPNDEAHRDIMSIRSVHGKIASLCNSSEDYEKVRTVEVSDRGHVEPPFPLYPGISQDISRQAEAKVIHSTQNTPWLYLNQADMSLTQYAFMGILLAHPEKLGAGAATEKELAGFIHFWRGIGWLLGVDDKYNFCSGSVEETKALCLDVERLIALPSLTEARWNYEHMATSLISGMSVIFKSLTFPMMFRYLAYTIGVSVPSLVKRMSFTECFHYWMARLTFKLMLIFPRFSAISSHCFGSLVTFIHKNPKGNGRCPFTLKKHYS